MDAQKVLLRKGPRFHPGCICIRPLGSFSEMNVEGLPASGFQGGTFLTTFTGPELGEDKDPLQAGAVEDCGFPGGCWGWASKGHLAPLCLPAR